MMGGGAEGDALADLCASYQEAIVDVLIAKTLRAAAKLDVMRVAAVGGVAVNSRLRRRIVEECERRSLTYYTVQPIHSTDNAAMIGIVGWHKLREGKISPLTTIAKASMIRAARGKGKGVPKEKLDAPKPNGI